MKKRRICWILFIGAVTLISFSCGADSGPNEWGKNQRVTLDLLKDFDVLEKATLTRVIDAVKPKWDSYFISGWHRPERDLRWAQGYKSAIMFEAAQTQDLIMETECRSVKLKGAEKQKVQIFLNSKHIETLYLEPRFQVCKVSLPKKKIHIGKNILTFEYDKTERPSDLSDTRDKRLLSAAFKSFKFFHSRQKESGFSRPLLQKKSGEVLHFPGNAFISYLKASGSEKLIVKISHLPKNIKACLKIDSGDHSQNLVFKKAGFHSIQLKKRAGPFTKLAFYLERQRKIPVSLQDFVIWSEIKILEPFKETKTAFKLQNLEQNLRSQELDMVYVVMDAFHAKHSSLYGYQRNTTPFLQKIGEQNIVFQNFYANSPYTLASTGTLFTSRYPHEHGLVEKDTKINPELPKLQKILSEHGISSFLITGQPWFSKGWGLSKGFTQLFFNPYQLIIQEALTSIYSHHQKEDQKFIYIHLHPPHAPYLPPPQYQVFPTPKNISFNPTPQNFRKIENNEIPPTDELLDYIESMYDANVLYADSLAKSIYNFFEQRGLLDQTVMIFTSDHGEASRMQHGKLGHNTTLFQEMVHIPFVMVFPEKWGWRCINPQVPASVVDAPATILDVFGISEDFGFRGKTLLPYILMPKQTSGLVFLENLSGTRQQKGIIGHRYKFISTKDKEMLFDLWTDSSEKTNLLYEMPSASGYFRQILRTYARDKVFQSQKMDLETIDKETRERLKSLGYIK
ncbi:MAG: sulfatase-like hydrolase/transferase [Candidatus Aminicenantes bacterium]|nr:sulfatase-like hydrolase/transferase [Candidatus Aminicenantes bacterium]